jgi:hypothetical protein
MDPERSSHDAACGGDRLMRPAPRLSHDPANLAELEDAVRSLAPADFGDGPVYVVLPADVLDDPCDVWAFVTPALDLVARESLEQQGRWRGRGWTMCVNLPVMERAVAEAGGHMGDLVRLAYTAMVHEAAHLLAEDRFRPERKIVPRDFAAWCVALAEDLTTPVPPRNLTAEPWRDHGAEFIRCGLHLTERAESLYPAVRIDIDSTFGGAYYGLSTAMRYWKAIGDEPAAMKGVPLREILATPAPAAFTELFASDTSAWHRAAAVFSPVSVEPEGMFETLRESLKQRRRGKEIDFDAMARRLADGDSPKPDDVEQVLIDSQKSIDDLESLVTRYKRRAELQLVLKRATDAEAALPGVRAKIKKHDEEFTKAEEKHNAAVQPLIFETRRLEDVSREKHQATSELFRTCPNTELREQYTAAEKRLQELHDERKRTQALLGDAKSELSSTEYKIQFGSRQNFSKESLQESVETYKGRVDRHEAAIAALVAEESNMIANRDALYAQLVNH